jgi:hypothetical protein
MVGKLLSIADRRPPDFIIGSEDDPYLLRWFVIPRNRFFNIYLHCIRRSDDDRAYHDHPWFNLSIILRGKYWEQTPKGLTERRTGDWVVRSPWSKHILRLFCDKTGATPSCWTLFITGPRLRTWGFHCPQGFVPWQIFTAPNNPGEIGRGCGS